MINVKSIAAAAIAAVAIVAPSNAQEFTFQYDSWMLSSSQGREAVLDRLERSITNYCNVREARGALQRQLASDCSERVTANALEQLDDPRIIALYQERQREREATRRA